MSKELKHRLSKPLVADEHAMHNFILLKHWKIRRIFKKKKKAKQIHKTNLRNFVPMSPASEMYSKPRTPLGDLKNLRVPFERFPPNPGRIKRSLSLANERYKLKLQSTYTKRGVRGRRAFASIRFCLCDLWNGSSSSTD
jgi:hypothetical protein